MDVNPIYPFIKELKEVTDVKKVAKLLSTGDWIAINATASKPALFVMGRVN